MYAYQNVTSLSSHSGSIMWLPMGWWIPIRNDETIRTLFWLTVDYEFCLYAPNILHGYMRTLGTNLHQDCWWDINFWAFFFPIPVYRAFQVAIWSRHSLTFSWSLILFGATVFWSEGGEITPRVDEKLSQIKPLTIDRICQQGFSIK